MLCARVLHKGCVRRLSKELSGNPMERQWHFMTRGRIRQGLFLRSSPVAFHDTRPYTPGVVPEEFPSGIS